MTAPAEDGVIPRDLLDIAPSTMGYQQWLYRPTCSWINPSRPPPFSLATQPFWFLAPGSAFSPSVLKLLMMHLVLSC